MDHACVRLCLGTEGFIRDIENSSYRECIASTQALFTLQKATQGEPELNPSRVNPRRICSVNVNLLRLSPGKFNPLLSASKIECEEKEMLVSLQTYSPQRALKIP